MVYDASDDAGREAISFKVSDYLDRAVHLAQQRRARLIGSDLSRSQATSTAKRHKADSKAEGGYWYSNPSLNDPELLRLNIWRKVHELNNLGLHFDGVNEILFGRVGTQAQWSSIIPESEQCIVNLAIWLREVGALNGHFGSKTQQILAKVCNEIPMTPWMGHSMGYEVGGVALLPTKKAMWRLCLVAMSILYDQAESKVEDYQLDVNDLLARWADSIKGEGIAKVWDNKVLFMGKGYLENFPQDYTKEELRIIESINDKTEIVNVFESHVILMKNPVEEILTPDGMTRILRRNQDNHKESCLYQERIPEDGLVSHLTESFYLWRADREARQSNDPEIESARYLPQRLMHGILDVDTMTCLARTYVHPVGPVRYLAYNPITTVALFNSSLRRNLCDKREKFVLRPGSELSDISDLAYLFLQLVQCTTPSQLWEIEYPFFFTDRPPTPTAPVKCDTRIRQPTYAQDSLTVHMTIDKWQEVHEALQQIEDEQKGGAYGEGCNEYQEQIVSATCTDGRVGALKRKRDEPSDGAFCRTGHLKSDQAVLAEVELEISMLVVRKQINFEQWVEQFGRSAALNKQLLLLPGSEDDDIAHLWSVVKGMTEQGCRCNGHCFAELRGLPVKAAPYRPSPLMRQPVLSFTFSDTAPIAAGHTRLYDELVAEDKARGKRKDGDPTVREDFEEAAIEMRFCCDRLKMHDEIEAFRKEKRKTRWDPDMTDEEDEASGEEDDKSDYFDQTMSRICMEDMPLIQEWERSVWSKDQLIGAHLHWWDEVDLRWWDGRNVSEESGPHA